MIINIMRFLTEDIDVEKKTLIDNGIGGLSEDWELKQTIKGRIRPLSGSEQLSADKRDYRSTHKLYTLLTQLSTSDRLRYNNEIYRIHFIKNPMTLDNHLEVDLELTANDRE